jgi:CrcB protein
MPHPSRAPVVLLLVFSGGALGSLARELLTPILPAPWVWFPTLLVNLAACALIGWLFTQRGRLSSALVHFLVGGFCGGFSTFSHFTLELVRLADAGAAFEASAYVAAALALGIAAAMLGERLGTLRGAGPPSAGTGGAGE